MLKTNQTSDNEFFKDSIQQNKEVNYYEIGRSVYSKMSKKNLIKFGKQVHLEQEIFIN